MEGLVADRNLGLGDLIGTIKTFFEQIGITQVRFKPAYNPYTEPSMEIFGFHPELKKWTEIGNSGSSWLCFYSILPLTSDSFHQEFSVLRCCGQWDFRRMFE